MIRCRVSTGGIQSRKQVHNKRKRVPLSHVLTFGTPFFLFSECQVAAQSHLRMQGFLQSHSVSDTPPHWILVRSIVTEAPKCSGSFTQIFCVMVNSHICPTSPRQASPEVIIGEPQHTVVHGPALAKGTTFTGTLTRSD